MKTILSSLLIGCFLLTSCGTVILPSAKSTTPPGQAKKITGDQSAKAYAPGQQKPKNGKGKN